ncbi:MAG: 5-keto-L-gluconate epimerase [Candidatus Atribacteria bacterium]|nr:5-keto-L-gluconate epimerase [Candidatus Atribacteria bacterium]
MKLSFAVSLQKTKFGAIAFGESFTAIVSELKKLGYQGIELAVRNPNEIEMGEVKPAIDDSGLTVPAIGTGQAFIEEGLSLSSLEAGVRKKTIERLKSHVDFASQWRSLVIIGLIRGNLPLEEEKRGEALAYFKESLLECSHFAKEKGIKLVIEPLNRYEINFLNTIEETSEFISSLQDDNLGILADSFHMNIEEVDFYQSIFGAGKYIWHFHVADSNRWAPGWGHTDFTSIFRALQDINYQGFVSAEIIQQPNFSEAAKQTINYLIR